MTLLTQDWSAVPVLQPVQEQKQRHVLSRLLLGYFLSASSISAAVVWAEIVYWPFPMLTLELASADIAQTNRQTKGDRLTARESRTPHLEFHYSSGPINEPLPLNITLNNVSGGETLILSGLPASAKLSAGTDLGSTRWSVPGRDLTYAFIAAPENFSGLIQVTATLYSSANAVIETRDITYHWTDGRTENQFSAVGRTAGSQGRADLTVEDRDAIRSSTRVAPIIAYGTEASPPIRQLPTPGQRGAGLSPAGWVSQIAFGEMPLAQVSSSRTTAKR